MSYPVVTLEKGQELAAIIRSEVLGLPSDGKPLDVEIDERRWVEIRPGDGYEPSLLDSCGRDRREQISKSIVDGLTLSAVDAWNLEAWMAGEVHRTLEPMGMDPLCDEDFWRYLALFPLRWFLIAREPELQPQDFGGFVLIVDDQGRPRRKKKALITQLIYRTYLWGKIAFEQEARDPYKRATQIADLGGPSIDIWHSHLIRTQLGQLGQMPHAFIDVIIEDVPDSTEMKSKARNLEKRIARLKHNVLVDILHKSEADSVVREQLVRVE